MQAINEIYLQGSNVNEEEYNGNMILVRDVVTYYITHCILPFDSSKSRPDFTIMGTEASVECQFSFEGADGQSHTVTFAGKSDRIDCLEDGTLRIVDYKTGAPHIEFSGIDSLFDKTLQKLNSAVFQTLLYSLMFSKKGYKELMFSKKGYKEVQPALYYVRDMQNKEYSPLLQMGGGKQQPGKTEISRFSMVQKEFEEKLRETLRKLFDCAPNRSNSAKTQNTAPTATSKKYAEGKHLKPTQNPGRIPHGNHIRRHILCDDTTGSDDRPLADGYARTDHGTASDPTIIPDRYRTAGLDRFAPLTVIHRMDKGVDLNRRPDQDMFSNSDRSTVQHNTIIIDKTAFSHIEIVSVITKKRRTNHRSLRHMRKEFAKYRTVLFALHGRCIEPQQQLLGSMPLLAQLGSLDSNHSPDNILSFWVIAIV